MAAAESVDSVTPRNSKPSTQLLLTLLIILGIATTLRVKNLGHEALWMDEAASLRATSGGFTDVLAHVRHFEVKPPLYFLVLETSARFLGSSDSALRVPSVLAGVAMIPVLMFIAGQIGGRLASTAAGAIAACSWIAVYYSQEARAYALFLLLAALSTAIAVQLMRRTSRSMWIAYCCACILLMYTHFGAVFVMASHACGVLVAVIGADRRSRLSISLMWAAAAIVIATLSLPALQLARVVGHRAPGAETRTWLGAMRGAEAYPFYAGGWIPLLVLTALAILGLCSSRIRNSDKAILVALAVLPVFGHLLLWRFGGPFFTPRHGLAAFLGLILSASLGIAQLPGKASAIVGVVVAGLVLLNTIQNEIRFRKPDMRQAARFVADHAHGGDTVVVSLMMAGWSFDRYFARDDVRRRNYDDFTIGKIFRGQEGMKRLWLVLNPLPTEPQFLEIDNPMRIVSRTDFYHVSVVELERKPE